MVWEGEENPQPIFIFSHYFALRMHTDALPELENRSTACCGSARGASSVSNASSMRRKGHGQQGGRKGRGGHGAMKASERRRVTPPRYGGRRCENHLGHFCIKPCRPCCHVCIVVSRRRLWHGQPRQGLQRRISTRFRSANG